MGGPQPPTEPSKISILGKEIVVVDYNIFGSFIVNDLLRNVPSSTYVLVTDTNLYDQYVPSFKKCFDNIISKMEAESRLLTYQIPPGETSKSRTTKSEVEDWMVSKARDPPCDTGSVLIALGGGVIVVGDMIGYVASSFMRGIKVIQIPTSLLAMVDSSIGGKTAIDIPSGKNLIGAFWQPARIYIDLQFLNSLPTREFINGLAEVIKTAAIWDKDAFEALESNVDRLMQAIKSPPSTDDRRLSSVKQILKDIVLGSVRVKAHVVSSDEREGGLRNLLNFGHSIGHAIEGILTPQILHGECVAIGMVLEAVLARYLGVLAGDAVSRLKKCLMSYELPVSLQDSIVQERSGYRTCSVDQLLSFMAVDKKNKGRKKRIVLLSGIGQTYERQATMVADCDIKVILSSGIKVCPSIPEDLKVSCTPPGSKSISNRALVLAALGNGTCRIRNFLASDDTEVMINALTKFRAASFKWENGGQVLVVEGRGGVVQASTDEVYVGNAGTAARFLTAVATLAKPTLQSHSILTGNEMMKKRKIGPLVNALRANDATIGYVGKDENPPDEKKTLPLSIKATAGISGGDIDLAATFSSQYVSSILMCAPKAKTPVILRLIGGKPVSQLYIDLTTAMQASFGINVAKSTSEEHTYHVPQGSYKNPSTYDIESDASSATYPLAIAAITGTTCTVPNIGTKSLQGDARFAVEVLRPMGCNVEQTENSTTVTGPPIGSLKPIREIDMEPMTDAFLTACVLAAVAQGGQRKSTTRIIGIENQHGKECDRIEAMKSELAKFGVTCRAFTDGIEIDGIKYTDLKEPPDGVHCYDDHRVAMSLSVLALITPQGALIREKECVGKTWPGWWDTLRQTFGVEMEGVDPTKSSVVKPGQTNDARRSIYLIGMRGAGKTTTAKWTAEILNRTFIDLDSQLEQELNDTIPNIIEESGWDGLRDKELAVLKKTMHEKPSNHVFACGGGIVETAEARKMLKEYHQSGGLVILVSRDIDDVMAYLQRDKSRPAYVEDMRSVWLRRKAWYMECSNYQHYSQKAPAESPNRASKYLERFLHTITGQRRPLEEIKAKDRSFFVSLTVPDITAALDFLPEVIVGSDAVELRVDLLRDPQRPEGPPSTDFVANQLAILHGSTSLPVIFTIRTVSQGGKFPDNAHEEALSLYTLALRMGVEFLDLEMQFPESLLRSIIQARRTTKIIASHHDPKRVLSWSNGSWIPYYNKALQYGDIIKLVGVSTAEEDNLQLMQFKKWATSGHQTPMIAINMGQAGQLSRILNRFLTPVSHPVLPFKAAPGQLSAAEIRTALVLHGAITPRQLYLFGDPIAQSRSPAMHNTLFESTGLPHNYKTFETSEIKDLEGILRSENFGGASVTIPLKIDVMRHLDEISEDARIIGAVNTIVVDPSRSSTVHTGFHLTGRNTDWQGMTLVLQSAGAQCDSGEGALVVGGGGTARAAIYALHAMGYAPIYVLGRSHSKIQSLLESFPHDFNLKSLTTVEEAKQMSVTPIAIGTIPADKPIDQSMHGVLNHVFRKSKVSAPKKYLLEMAYKPAVTPLMQLAQAAEWTTIPGLEVLAGQAFYQFEAWTGIRPQLEMLRGACGLSSSR